MDTFDVGSYVNIDGYYKDEETNEIYKDNIDLNLKLGGYLRCKSSKSSDLPFDDGKIASTTIHVPENFDSSAVNSARTIGLNNLEEYFKAFTSPIDSMNNKSSFYKTCVDELNDYKNTSPNQNTFKMWANMSPVSNHEHKNFASQYMTNSHQFSLPKSLSVSDMRSDESLDLDLDFDLDMDIDMTTDENSELNFFESIDDFITEDTDYDIASEQPVTSNQLDFLDSPYSSSSRSSSPLTPQKEFDDEDTSKFKIPSPDLKILPPTFCETIMKKFDSSLHDIKAYPCYHCDHTFESLYKYLLHCDKEDLFKNLKYKCPVGNCTYRLIGMNKKMSLRKHVIEEHYDRKSFAFYCKSKTEIESINQLIFTCNECYKVFYRKDSLKRHLRLIHNPNAK